MRSIDGIGNWVLIIMATTSLISIIAVLSLHSIVTQDLPSYGLQFNYRWAIPYWNTITAIIVMSCSSITAAITFEIYRIRTIRKDEANEALDQTATQETKEEVQVIQFETETCEQIESASA